MRKTKFSRALAVLLAASMVFGAAPVNLQAEELLDEVVDEVVEISADDTVDDSSEVIIDFEESMELEAADLLEAGSEAPDTGTVDSATDTQELEFDDDSDFIEELEIVEDPMLETVDVGTYDAFGTGDYSIYVTVEKYDAAGNGTYMLEPTVVNYSYGEKVSDLLKKVFGEYMVSVQNSEIYGICVEGNWIQNGTDGTWIISNNNEVLYPYDSNIQRGGTEAGLRRTWNGRVIRFIFNPAGGTNGATVAAGETDCVWNTTYDKPDSYSFKVNKDGLIKILANYTEEQKEENATAYNNALKVILNGQATAQEVANAVAGLEQQGTDPYVYFEYKDGTIQRAKNGSFTLSALDEGCFKVANASGEIVWPSEENEETIPVQDPWTGAYSIAYHWYVNKYTGAWQPSGRQPVKKVTVQAGDYKTSFKINYVETGITELKTYIGESEVSLESPFSKEGRIFEEDQVFVTTKGLKNGEWVDVPVQTLNYQGDDRAYNFRFIGNCLLMNREGEHTMTVSLKDDADVCAKFKASCGKVEAETMKVVYPDTVYIDEWDAAGGTGEGHYVGLRPFDGYSIKYTPANATNVDTTWVALNPDIAYYKGTINSDGIVPVKAGTAQFEVTNNENPELKELVTINFVYKHPLENVITDDNYTMTAGTDIYLNLDFNPTNATEQRFSWTYDKEGIVAVKDRINSSEDGMTSWTTHKMTALNSGIVKVTGTPVDNTAGCQPVVFTVAVGGNKSDAQAAMKVYDKISAITGVITLDSEAAIKDARTAYNALTDSQKAILAKEKILLEAAENELDYMKKMEQSQANPVHVHSFGEYKTVKAATVFESGLKERTCACGQKESQIIGKLTPALNVTVTKLPLKVKQSTTKLKVTGMANGDSVKSWKSSNTKIFKVSGKANGTCKITAGSKTGKATLTITLASGLQKKVTITVQKGTVNTTKITGLKSSLTLAKGKKTTLKPVLTPITSQQKITYSSSNKRVAVVTSKGVITAKSAGTAKITVKSGSKKYTVKVTVPKTKTTKITGIKESITVKKGKTYTLKPKLTPKASDEKVTYKSSNKKVATVTSSGKIKGIKKGTATITVKSGSVSVKCKVTVK